MMNDARLGLPLSLVEALRADASPLAVGLADLLEQEEPPTPVKAARNCRARP